MEEVWKDTDYNYIEVSNFGNVRTKDTIRAFKQYDRHNRVFKITSRLIKSHPMKIQTNNRGYKFVCFKEEGKRKNLLVHRLVGIAFIPNLENKLEINHKDGNPANNHINNLEWVTPSENRKHAYWILGCPCFGKSRNKSKTTLL